MSDAPVASRAVAPLAVALLACTTPTQVVVHVTADPESSARAGFLTLELYAPDGGEVPRYAETASFFGESALTRLAEAPARLTVVPRDGDASRAFRLVATLRDSSRVDLSRRTVVSTFSEGTLSELWIHFDDACIGRFDCEGRTTCDGTVSLDGSASCAPACVAPSVPGATVRSELLECGDDCVFAADGSRCGADGEAGRCWDGACCQTCWDGARCLEADELSLDAYGIEGAECVACACAGDGLNPEGGCLPPAPVRGVRAGTEHACASFGGRLQCWGSNDEGQLGTGERGGFSATPREVFAASLAILGDAHTCALEEGVATCWGDGSSYQLGQGEASSVTSPGSAEVLGGPYELLAAGQWHTCGVASGEVYCWGANSDGECGQGHTELEVETPSAVALPAPVTDIDIGRRTTCAIADRRMWCWGFNDHAAAGAPRIDAVLDAPTDVSEGLEWRQVSVGAFGTCGVTVDGRLFCRGYSRTDVTNDLAGDVPGEEHRMVQVGSERWREIALGAHHLCGIRLDDTLVCLGQNEQGQLGGEAADARVVHGPVGFGWRTVSSGWAFSCARRRDDAVFCWGASELGQLGAPELAPATPVRVCPEGGG